MVRNRLSQGQGIVTRNRPNPLGGKIVTEKVSSPKPQIVFKGDRSRVAFLVEEGVVEVHDPRLFRTGREPFCEALVKEAVGLGLARKVEVRLASASCRMEFEPGLFDRNTLADRFAATLNAASSRSLDSNLKPEDSGTLWSTLIATRSADGPLISMTSIDSNPGIIRSRRQPIDTPKISPHSGRYLRKQPRPLVRHEAPAARNPKVILSPESSRRRNPARMGFETGRVFDLAIAGGSIVIGLAGLILPGIPALPFILLGGHFLLRSSPQLCRRLRTLPGVATLLRQAEEIGTRVIDQRSLMKILGVTALTMSTFLILHPPLPLVLLLEGGIFAYYGLQDFQNPPHNPRLEKPALSLV